MGAVRPSRKDKPPQGTMSVGLGPDSGAGVEEACQVYIVEMERQLQWTYNEPRTPLAMGGMQCPLVERYSPPQCYDNLSITVAASVEQRAAGTGDINLSHTQQAAPPGSARGTLHCYVEAKSYGNSETVQTCGAVVDSPSLGAHIANDNTSPADRPQAVSPQHNTADGVQQAAAELHSAVGEEHTSAEPLECGACAVQPVAAADRGSSEEGSSGSSQDASFVPVQSDDRKLKRGHKKSRGKQRNSALDDVDWDNSQPTPPRLGYMALRQPQLGKRKKDEVTNILMPLKKDKS